MIIASSALRSSQIVQTLPKCCARVTQRTTNIVGSAQAVPLTLLLASILRWLVALPLHRLLFDRLHYIRHIRRD